MSTVPTTPHRDLPPDQRLRAINDMIAENPDLARLGFKYHKLGRTEEGEPEIIELTEIRDDSRVDPFHIYLHFRVRLPDGKEAARPVRVNRNGNGACMIVIINGKFAVVKQPRLPLGMKWTYEFPRGYSEALDSTRIEGSLGQLTLADLKLGVVQRELGEEVVANSRISSIAFIGNMLLNTGPDATITPVYLVIVMVKGEHKKIRGDEEGIEVQLWDEARLDEEIGDKIVDAITLGMIGLYRKWRKSLPA